MRKEGWVFIFLLVLIMPFILAEDLNQTETSKINKAYSCLENKSETKCSTLSLEQQIFSLLAIGNCKNEVKAAASSSGCWPASNCDVKSTAQAILALNNAGENTDNAQNWLLSQNKTPDNLNWFLEIESSEETTCTISYSGTSHTVTIKEDKTISSSAGTCLSLSQGNYWLKIALNCLDVEFSVSCDKSFLTTLLFKKVDSSTIYVSKDSEGASAGGTTTTKVNSFCFANGNQCSYEGSLWAALALDNAEEDVSSFIPYLTTMAEDNDKFIPESFLYLLTGFNDFRNTLLLKQKGNYWEESGDKYYDTALALLALQDQVYIEKTNAKEWLLESQDSDGCWQGNVRNTAFILYSVWPEPIFNGGTIEPDCKDQGFDCVSSINCEGQTLDYECGGLLVCCDTPTTLETCLEMNGDICSSNEDCAGGTEVTAFDTSYCCVEGTCQEVDTTEYTCELNEGTCESSGNCDEGFEDSSYTCEFPMDACCIPTSSTKPGSSIFIWILAILVLLVIIGIVLKDKLRVFWFRLKSGGGSRQEPRPGPGFPPMYPPISRPPIQRRILPPSQPRPIRMPITKKSGGEMDEVLKKLKEMGS